MEVINFFGLLANLPPLTVRSHMMNRRIIAPKASKTGFNPLHKTRSILAVNKRGVP